jgi:hypothetical protein
MAFSSGLFVKLFSTRATTVAHVPNAGADGTRPAIRSKVDLQIEIVPADGISAASTGNGDFGTSPFFGQFFGQATARPRPCIWGTGIKAQ